MLIFCLAMHSIDYIIYSLLVNKTKLIIGEPDHVSSMIFHSEY